MSDELNDIKSMQESYIRCVTNQISVLERLYLDRPFGAVPSQDEMAHAMNAVRQFNRAIIIISHKLQLWGRAPAPIWNVHFREGNC